MSRPPPQTAWQVAESGWQLWQDAATVMWLRSWRLWQGGKLGEREAQRMVSEKIAANATLGLALLPGLLAAEAPERLAERGIRHYAPKVAANRRRLSRR